VVHNEAAAHFVSEYIRMGWLKKLCYTFNPADLDVITSYAFIAIGSFMQSIEAKEQDGRRSTNRTRGTR